MNVALKIIFLFLSVVIPCFIADSQRGNILVFKVNKLQNRWKADLNYFGNLSESQVLARMGSKINPHDVQPKPARVGRGRSFKKIPKEFDARKEWPGCYVIGNVKDQSSCGSCWAVSTASAFSDRRCIAHKQKTNLEFSAEDILTCCHKCLPDGDEGDGCDGGYMPIAWDYIHNHGVVTGGDYGSRNTCKPYSVEPCEGAQNNTCEMTQATKCQSKCTNEDYWFTYKKDKKFGGWTYELPDEKSAKRDLMENGPFVALLQTCYDFLYYESGIYSHLFGECAEVYHAVKVIGWGETNGVDYWLVMNTWNTSWGDEGLFKIDITDNKVDFGYFAAGMVSPLH